MAEYNFTIENKTSSGYDQLYPATKGAQVDVSSVASAIGESGPLNVEQALTSLYSTATNKTGFPKIVTTIEPGRINSEMDSLTTHYSYNLPFAKTLTKMPSMVFLDIGRDSDKALNKLAPTFVSGYGCMHNVRLFLIRQDDGTFNAYVWGPTMSNAPFLPTSSGTSYDYSKNNVAFGFYYAINVDRTPTSGSSSALFSFTYWGNNASTFGMFGGTSFTQYPTAAASSAYVVYIGGFSYSLTGVNFYMWYGSNRSSTNYNLVDYRGIVYE